MSITYAPAGEARGSIQRPDRQVGRAEIAQAYARAKAILEEHRGQLELVAGELLRHETLDAAAFQQLLRSKT